MASPALPSHPPCRFESLAVVEQQLCFQTLSLIDRLALAQCSRSLRRVAEHPLAWKDVEIARVNLLRLDPSVGLSPFLRYMPLSPCWSASGWRVDRGLDMLLKANLTLYELDSSRCVASPSAKLTFYELDSSRGASSSIWKDMLDPSLPMHRACLAKLVRLRLLGYSCAPKSIATIHYIASIQTLRALHIHCSVHVDGDVWSVLGSMHQLTSLIAECDQFSAWTHRAILALQALPNLTHLCLSIPPRCSVTLGQMLAAPTLRRLRSLSLWGSLAENLDEDLGATFAEMHALESAHFTRYESSSYIDRIIRQGMMHALS